MVVLLFVADGVADLSDGEDMLDLVVPEMEVASSMMLLPLLAPPPLALFELVRLIIMVFALIWFVFGLCWIRDVLS